ncbi:MAG: transglutaminase domain-containing protein [candidate division WS1 bacterium]|jgi:transglutaminase-like putative cysteine protease|nr:transglutaminase domain-containing protein [candidate division WS1 bacterium]
MRPLLTATIIATVIAVLAMTLNVVEAEGPLTAEELEQLVGTDWYSVRIFGQPNGYARIETDIVETEHGPRLRTTEDLKILISLGGQSLEAGKTQVTIYDEQLRPASIEMDKNELGRSGQLSAVLEGDELVVQSSSPDNGTLQPRMRRIELPDDFSSDAIISARVVRGQLAVGDGFSYSVYDPEVDLIDRHFVEVAAGEEIDGVETLLVKSTSEQLGVEVLSWMDADGRLIRQSVPGLMDLTLERVSEEEALAGLAPFEILSEIRVEQHLPLVRSLQQVRLRISSDNGSAAEMIPHSDRQSVEQIGEDVLVTISREMPPTDTLPLPISDEAFAECLATTTQVQSDDPRIMAKAREIIGDETDSWAAAQMLCAWVRRNMQSVSSEPRPITALEVLDSMRGDCTEHAILLAALGRAVGLPTKLATGLAYVGGRFGYHAWTQVYVGRWVEMDPSWGEMTADAGHMLIYSSALDDASYARASLATGRTLGAIGMEIIGYTTADGRLVDVGEE